MEFFDSFAQPPQDYPNIFPWLQGLKRPIAYLQNCRLQGPKAYCGAYCYFFVTHRHYHSRVYAVFFNDAICRFGHCPPASIHQLSEMDSFMFNVPHNQVEQLVSIFD